MSQENVETVRRCVELFNRRDVEEVLELLDPDIELDLSRNIFNPDIYHGHAGIERWRNAVEDVWDDFHGTVEDIIDSDDKVVGHSRWEERGRRVGSR